MSDQPAAGAAPDRPQSSQPPTHSRPQSPSQSPPQSPTPQPTPPPPPAAWKLVSVLAGAGALAGLLLMLVHQATAPAIAAHAEARRRAAVEEVLQQPARFEELYVLDDALVARLPEGVEPAGLERVYAGYDAQDRLLGYAVTAERTGYQDVVRLLFGYDPSRGELLGMTVLASKETPGLGDSIEKDEDFVAQFAGVRAPLVGVKPGAAKDEHSVQMISGATISSRAVIGAIQDALQRLGPLLERGLPGGPLSTRHARPSHPEDDR